MGELLDVAVNPANILITALAVFMLVYWITVLIGLFDIDVINIDVDLDADVDVDIDPDVDVEGGSMIGLNSILVFFNLGKIPFMLFLSFWIIPAWIICINVNHILGNSSFLLGLLVLLGALIVSLFVSKFLTYPFVKLFDQMQSDRQNDFVIGKICEITITASETKTGQAQVKTEGAPHILSVRTVSDAEMKKGETGLVLEYNQNLNLYIIEPFK
ncbi:OB-fold-containig protein [Fulvivirga ligni]|uniref:OB-fold-containig protein n=1 Tax=Fulvivirga ligni TaxID=2904246 RepID=UPI001F3FC7B4|nr:OB-fold-containig protein [Fulvivirga ligni]UII23145.1 DUF1449 family protein [Fulvivirga ligni]